MQNEPTLQQLAINLKRMGVVAATGDATRRALVRADFARAERERMTEQQDAEARAH